jgi:hypothetical protein
MDRSERSISPNNLYAGLGSEATRLVIDAWRDADIGGAVARMADGSKPTVTRFGQVEIEPLP